MYTVLYISVALVTFEYAVGVLVVFLMSNYLPLIQTMNTIQRLGVAMLAGVMMVARSPSAIIAVVAEMKAQGRYTNIIVGVTILCDAIVILFYNLNDLVVGILMAAEGTAKSIVVVMGEFIAQVLVSSLSGLIFSIIMIFLVLWPVPAG